MWIKAIRSFLSSGGVVSVNSIADLPEVEARAAVFSNKAVESTEPKKRVGRPPKAEKADG